MSATKVTQEVGSAAIRQALSGVIQFDAVVFDSKGVRVIWHDNTIWDGSKQSFSDPKNGIAKNIAPAKEGGRGKRHKNRKANDDQPTCTLDGVAGAVRYYFVSANATPQARKALTAFKKWSRVIEKDEVYSFYNRDAMMKFLVFLEAFYPGISTERKGKTAEMRGEWIQNGFWANPDHGVDKENNTPLV